MKRSLLWLVWLMLTVFVLACGGGSGGPGGGGGGGGGFGFTPKPGQYFEFSYVSNGNLVDPLNLRIGDFVQMVLANYDGLGTRTVLPSSSWSVSNGAFAFSLDSVTGRFTVLASPGAFFKFQTTAIIGGTPTLFEQDGFVPTVAPLAVGRVVELGAFTGFPTSIGIPYLQVEFFDAGGTRVGAARTNGTGDFSASVPTTVTHMMILGSTIKTSHYYKSIYFLSLYYTPLITTCRVPTGSLGAGVNTFSGPLAVPVLGGPPPPPPTGCP